MKTALSFFIFFMTAYGYSFQSYAQTMTSASVFATIVNPITIERTDDLNLNSAPGKSGGIVFLSQKDIYIKRDITPYKSGNIELVELMIKGEDLSSFSISLPVFPLSLKNISNNETIVVNRFISELGTTGVLSAGKKTLMIRAQLIYTPTQAAGIYFSPSPIDITVNYY